MRGLSGSVRVPCGVVVSARLTRAECARNGVSSLVIAFAFAGYGFLRYPERPVLGGALMVVGMLNMLVSGASFGLAVWGDR